MPMTRSRPTPGRGYHGPIPKDLWSLLAIVWETGLSVQSNLAREWAPLVSLAASLGWISTVSLDGTGYLRTWNITSEGVNAYEHRETYRTARRPQTLRRTASRAKGYR